MPNTLFVKLCFMYSFFVFSIHNSSAAPTGGAVAAPSGNSGLDLGGQLMQFTLPRLRVSGMKDSFILPNCGNITYNGDPVSIDLYLSSDKMLN